MHPESKRAGSTKTQLNDGFSDLPESILVIILSHLPTVEAVRTCVLSKSWRTMWTNVTALQFDDKRHRAPRDDGFIQFVDLVVRHVGSLRINSFHLYSVNPYDETPIISWLSKVIECNLQKLVITWYELESVNFSPLFASLGTLVELRLRTKTILDISAPALLPNVKFFTLEDARIFNTSSLSGNISLSFPVLETFEATSVCWFRTDTVIIDSPLLRVFEMLKCSSGHVPNSNGECTISLLAPKLEKITFSGHGSEKMFLSFPPSLPDAYLSLTGEWAHPPEWPKKFLENFTCVKSLGLELISDHHVIKVPKFRQLVYLLLIYDMTEPYLLKSFLKSTPILEMLSICDSRYHGFEPTSESLEEMRSQTAAECVRKKLKVLQIRGFKIREPQLSVLRHVIANAEVLGAVILSTSSKPITEKDKALVLSYPKASPHASVFFD
ncbi:unnamed protein product [Thlaspi arvense]|uniref:F-box domain-containing protein n=1 Tax=Thlaspi arvense TaxID=13288 RepID=A0AAU9S2Q6_THLAR|nr:unnamed protein product [Thlaspi arvense]